MQFGKVDDPSKVDFSLPETPKETLALLKKNGDNSDFEAYVGCAKWNKKDLKGFYPRGTKDELVYYAKQFNSIELNATFYHSPTKSQVETWVEKVPDGFKFFPKLPNSISHFSRLLNTGEKVKDFVDSTVLFEDHLGMAFLQMHDNYKPKDFERLQNFLEEFPKNYPLALEVRNEEWFADQEISNSLYALLEKQKVTNIIVDTAGRRDMLHMRLTSPVAFIRYVGANHASDYSRLDEWVDVLKTWKKAGLQKLYFFVHQNIELESPLLATYFIEKLNKSLGTSLISPNKSGSDNGKLF